MPRGGAGGGEGGFRRHPANATLAPPTNGKLRSVRLLGVHPGSTPKRWFHQQLSFADPELGAAAPVLALQLSPDYKTHHSEVGRCSWARRLASMRTRGGHLPPTAVNRSHESTATLPRSDSPTSLIRWAPQEKCRGCTCSRRKIPPKQKPGGGVARCFPLGPVPRAVRPISKMTTRSVGSTGLRATRQPLDCLLSPCCLLRC